MIGARRFGMAMALVAGFFWSTLVSGDTTTWIGAANSTGSWSQVGNWNNGLPAAGMDVSITNGNVLLDAETPSLNLFQMSGGKLIFSNWTTRLVATNINLNGGLVTLPPAFTNTVPSNRVWFVCDQNFLLATGVVIDALGKGYIQNIGPGKGVGLGGGGYGGSGGIVGGEGGVAYGVAATPYAPGSGGGLGSTSKGGPGGGAVLIEALGSVTINGTIRADGSNAYHTAAGGSGGSVYITCATFGGLTNGLISAAGGDGCFWTGYGWYLGHGGGGGRIAIGYANLAEIHGVRFAASKGPDNADLPLYPQEVPRAAEMGTLWLPDAALLSESMGDGLFKDVRLVIPGFSAWSVGTLSISNCSFVFDAPVTLTVTNTLRIAKGSLGVRGDVTVQNGNLELGSGGGLHVYASPTNGAGPDYGALIQVGGDVIMATNGWLYPYADRTNGAAVLMRMQNLTIATNGGINADCRGFQDKKGPGAVGIADGGGAGYGGLGNVAGSVAGPVYGSTNNPVLPGSGGGQAIYGGFGGGAVRLAVSNAVTVNGTITANGVGNILSGAGCGSGGSININCQSFGGSGLISAAGGSSTINLSSTWYGGGGGGGRIAVQYASLASPRAIRFKTSGGLGTERNGTARAMLGARDGTLWLPDTQLLSETLIDNLFTGVRFFAPGFTSWAVDHLTVSNCSVTLPDGFLLTVTNDLLIGTTGKLSLVGGLLTVSQGNLRLTNGGALYVSSLATNGTPGDSGAKVEVAGDVTMGISSWIYPTADEAGGGAVQFVMKNLNVATNAGFDADGRGYSRGRGPGGGGVNTGRGGGGYGGKGSYHSTEPGGKIYGLTNAPLQAGSAGGYTGGNWEQSGYGGGLVWVEASGDVNLNGTVTADGRISGGSASGGGAGGGILISCQKFSGASTAKLRADGKNGTPWSGNTWYGGGGGGGRIAVWQKVTPVIRTALISSQVKPAKVTVSATPFGSYLGTVSVTNGFGWGDASTNVNDEATVGSIVFLEQLPPSGTVLLIR